MKSIASISLLMMVLSPFFSSTVLQVSASTTNYINPEILDNGRVLQFAAQSNEVTYEYGLSEDFIRNTERLVYTIPGEGYAHQSTLPCNVPTPPGQQGANIISLYLEAGKHYQFDIGRLDSEFDISARLYAGGISHNEIFERNSLQLSSRTNTLKEAIRAPLYIVASGRDERNFDGGPGGDPFFIYQPTETLTYTLVIGEQLQLSSGLTHGCPENFDYRWYVLVEEV